MNQCQLNLAQDGKDCWAYRVYKMLVEVGFGDIWYGQTALEVFGNVFKQRLIDIKTQIWRSNLENLFLAAYERTET